MIAGGVELGAVVFGLAASLSWGTSDFSGGVVTKRLHLAAVMAISYAGGLLLLIGLAAVWREPALPLVGMVWAGLAGAAGAIGLAAQYHALSVGRMGIAAPVAAVVGTMLPVVFSLAAEGLPATIQIAGFALALISVALIARSPARGTGPTGLGYAVFAGLGFGAFFILIDRASDDTVFWPLVTARSVALGVMLVWLLRTNRRQWHPSSSILPLVLLTGVLDVGGNTFFLMAAQAGRLDVATVLSSFYPAVTVLWARGVLNEEITPPQAVGIACAVIALPLVAG